MDGDASCGSKLMRQFETTGDCRSRKFGGLKKRARAAHEGKVRALVAAQPDPTITALGQKLTPLEIKAGCRDCPDTAALFQCRSDPGKSPVRIRVAGRAAVFFRNRHARQGCLGRGLLLRDLRRVSCRRSPCDARHATETVTEDMLTSFKMEEHGYRTIYLNEPLSMGLAPEGLHAYITQRSRWCLGAIQQIYTRRSFAGRAPLRPISRLSSFDGTFYWIFTFPFKILMLTAPMIYWWTGTAVIDAAAAGLIYWLAPSAAGGIIFICFYGRKFVLQIMTDLSQLLSSFAIMQTVIARLNKTVWPPV